MLKEKEVKKSEKAFIAKEDSGYNVYDGHATLIYGPYKTLTEAVESIDEKFTIDPIGYDFMLGKDFIIG